MDAVITKSVYNSWIFQDPKKLKWWADLHHLADENGEIHMSLSDLSLRWNTPKTTVHRFLSKLASGTIGGTKNYAGYIFLPDGRVWVFAVMVNSANCKTRKIQRVIEQYLLDVYQANK